MLFYTKDQMTSNSLERKMQQGLTENCSASEDSPEKWREILAWHFYPKQV